VRQPNKGKSVVDPIRKKLVDCGPEEEVRQAVIAYLRDALNVPAGLISVEKKLSGSVRTYRADIVVHSREGLPWMIVECKAPDVPIDQGAFDQIGAYNQSLRAPYALVTNGSEFYGCFFDFSEEQIRFLDEIPTFPMSD
jgi:hypothetical protein